MNNSGIFQVGFFLIVFGNKYSVEATVKMFFLYFTGMICMVLIQVFWELIFNKNTALIFILGYYTCAFTISSIIYDRAREFLKVIYLLVPSYMQGEFTNLTRTKDVGLYFSTFAALILIYILIIYIALQYAFKRKDII